MTGKQGTADELGTLDLGELGTLVVEDDGDDDEYVTTKVVDGGERWSNVRNRIRTLRSNMDDEDVMTVLDELNERLQHDPKARPDDSSTPSSLSRPVAFKCNECGRTCPRTWNANPGPGSDVCRECEEAEA